MDEQFELHQINFVWDHQKSKTNLAKHGISFEQAAEAFFDPFIKIVDASRNKELRDAIIGMDKQWNLLFVVHIAFEDDRIRVISARKVTRRNIFMKIENLKKRLNPNRPMIAVTIRMPEDVVDDLKQLAPLLGFSGYQPLIRAYVGQGIREDIEKIDNDKLFSLIASLKRHGVNEEIIEEALAEVA